MITRSAFDSDVLGVRVGKAVVEGFDRRTADALRAEIQAAGVDVVFVRDTAFDVARLQELPWDGLELADLKLVLTRPVLLLDAGGDSEFEISEDVTPADAPRIMPLVRAIAARSRFSRCFGERAAFQLYDRWLENSLARQAADWCFVAWHRSSRSPAGLITVTRAGTVADLALVATAEEFRGRGVLRLMTATVLGRLHAEGVGTCTVATQLGNRPAIRAYEALGFSFDSAIADFHLHRI